MPKINVYLPDDLAAAVKEAGIPVSPVCQKALAEAVQTVKRARQAIGALRRTDIDPARLPDLTARIRSRATAKLVHALEAAGDTAGRAGPVRPEHLLIALLGQPDNLGVRVLRALDVDTDLLEVQAVAAAEQAAADGGPDADDTAPGPSPQAGESVLLQSTLARVTPAGRLVLASMLDAALDLGHNYVGCEHLVLGLLREQDTAAARLLHGQGLDEAAMKRALAAATAGHLHAREFTGAAALQEIMRRLDDLERRLPPAAE